MSSVLYDLHPCMPFPNITCRQLARTSIYMCAWWSFFWRSVHDSHDNLLQEYCKRCPEVTTNPFGTYSLLGLYDWNFSNIIVPLHGLPRLIYIGLFFFLNVVSVFRYHLDGICSTTQVLHVASLRAFSIHYHHAVCKDQYTRGWSLSWRSRDNSHDNLGAM
jgi:hypothetical protein